MSKKNINILLVDDEEIIRETLSELLILKGYGVEVAESGVAALGIFNSLPIDVVLTDINMPNMGGHQFLEKLQEIKEDVPIIVISGMGTADNILKALKLGAYDFLIKPVRDVEFIEHAISKALEKSELLYLAKNYQRLFEESVKEKTRELEKDIKERKKIEKELLRSKQETMKTIDSIPDLIALFDNNHKIIRLNKAMEEFLGKTASEVLGKKVCLFKISCDGKCECHHNRVLENGKIDSTELHDETRGRIYDVKIIPCFDGDVVVGTVLLGRDITDIKKYQTDQTLLQTQLLQAQKLESVGQLAAGIAHEINTPTQYVSANLEFLHEAYGEINTLLKSIESVVHNNSDEISKRINLLLGDADLDYFSEEIPTAITQSSEGAERIRSIVVAMKEFSHPGSKEKEWVDLNKIIQTTITVARNEWKYVSEIKTVFQDDLPAVECLTNEIGQVFLNIIVNSAQAIGEKIGENPETCKGEILITTKYEGGAVIVTIKDDGLGMPEAIIDKVFDPFFTTKGVGKGTGQGLAIAHDVVTKKHDGTLSVKSKHGVGTTFVITLPCGEGE